MEEEEEPVTPMGRLCLLPEHNHIIHCALQLKNPIDLDAIKHEISNSIMVKLPRFSCIMTLNPRNGLEHWKKVHVDLNDHVIVHPNYAADTADQCMSDEDVVDLYLGDMAISSPMRMDKPLWELHILVAQKCIIMRVHHAIGDGMSLMSLLLTMDNGSPKVDNNNNYYNDNYRNNENEITKTNKNINNNTNNNINNKYDNNKGIIIWKKLVSIWYTMVYGIIFIVRCMWVKDKGIISGFMGLEFWPRKVASARFKISDMKTIKNAIPNATVNDVLCGILWCGLTRYLNAEYSTDLQDGVQITAMCPYNLRKQPKFQEEVGSMVTKNTMTRPWGNRFSVILLPFIYKKRELDPLAYVELAKDMMDKKKQSMEALLSYNVVSLGSTLFGPKVAGLFYYNLFCNTSFLISNMVGPSKLIYVGGNPVTSIRVSSSSQPHAMTMHMVSYGEWANLQVQVAQNVIPNPKILAKYYEDALLDMKLAAQCTTEYY